MVGGARGGWSVANWVLARYLTALRGQGPSISRSLILFSLSIAKLNLNIYETIKKPTDKSKIIDLIDFNNLYK